MSDPHPMSAEGICMEIDRLEKEIERLRVTNADLEHQSALGFAEIERLRAALEHIVREGQGVNKGQALVALAQAAIAKAEKP